MITGNIDLLRPILSTYLHRRNSQCHRKPPMRAVRRVSLQSHKGPLISDVRSELDVMGCQFVMAIDNFYQSNNSFSICEGEAAAPPGLYPLSNGSTSTFRQRYTGEYVDGGGKTVGYTVGQTITPSAPAFYPATSNCVSFSTISNGINTADYSVTAAPVLLGSAGTPVTASAASASSSSSMTASASGSGSRSASVTGSSSGSSAVSGSASGTQLAASGSPSSAAANLVSELGGVRLAAAVTIGLACALVGAATVF